MLNNSILTFMQSIMIYLKTISFKQFGKYRFQMKKKTLYKAVFKSNKNKSNNAYIRYKKYKFCILYCLYYISKGIFS